MGVDQLDPVEELRRRERQQALVAELGHSALTGTALTDLFAEALVAAADGLAVEQVEMIEPDSATNEPLVLDGKISVPIRRPGQAIGALVATSPDPHAFSGDDVLFLRALANLLGVAS